MQLPPGSTKRGAALQQTNKARGIRPGPSRHQLLLNQPEFRKFMASKGVSLTRPQDVAAYLDLGCSIVYNALGGKPLTGPFVSALAKKIGPRRRIDTFLIFADTPDEDAA